MLTIVRADVDQRESVGIDLDSSLFSMVLDQKSAHRFGEIATCTKTRHAQSRDTFEDLF